MTPEATIEDTHKAETLEVARWAMSEAHARGFQSEEALATFAAALMSYYVWTEQRMSR